MLGLLAEYNTIASRSIHRTDGYTKPSLHISTTNTDKSYLLQHNRLSFNTIFKTFNKEYFFKNLLPSGPISNRINDKEKILGAKLEACLDLLVQEIKKGKKNYTDFTVVQKRDFNKQKKSGLIILKFKHYPFMVKLFMETPESFINPHYKGFINVCNFYMGGGSNRHLCGFTRISNLEKIKTIIQEKNVWKNHITLPRKWFWLPQNTPWLALTGTHFVDVDDNTQEESYSIKIPAIYAVVADFIEADERKTSQLRKKGKSKLLNLCKDLDVSIDLHKKNFFIDKLSGNIALIDTEYFGVIASSMHKIPDNYFKWYFEMAQNCLDCMLFKTKMDK